MKKILLLAMLISACAFAEETLFRAWIRDGNIQKEGFVRFLSSDDIFEKNAQLENFDVFNYSNYNHTGMRLNDLIVEVVKNGRSVVLSDLPAESKFIEVIYGNPGSPIELYQVSDNLLWAFNWARK